MEMRYHKYQNHPGVELLRELLRIPSPPGREMQMGKWLLERIRSIGWEPEMDAAGNITVNINEATEGAAGIVLAAHMDEIALVVSRIEADGKLRVAPSGGISPQKLGECALQILGDNAVVEGVGSSGQGYGGGGSSQPSDWSNYWVTTGLKREQLKKAGVYPGSAIVPIAEGRGPLIFGDPDDPLLAAWTFDDRLGVIALLRLLELLKHSPVELRRPLVIAFTVHEEGGAHGAKVLAHRLRPEIFIAVDGCPDTPECDVVADARPVVWSKDLKANYDHKLILALSQAAASIGIELQRAVLPGVYSDASACYDCGAVPRVGVFGHVRENRHGFEVAKFAVMDNVLEVLHVFLQNADSA